MPSAPSPRKCHLKAPGVNPSPLFKVSRRPNENWLAFSTESKNLPYATLARLSQPWSAVRLAERPQLHWRKEKERRPKKAKIARHIGHKERPPADSAWRKLLPACPKRTHPRTPSREQTACPILLRGRNGRLSRVDGRHLLDWQILGWAQLSKWEWLTISLSHIFSLVKTRCSESSTWKCCQRQVQFTPSFPHGSHLRQCHETLMLFSIFRLTERAWNLLGVLFCFTSESRSIEKENQTRQFNLLFLARIQLSFVSWSCDHAGSVCVGQPCSKSRASYWRKASFLSPVSCVKDSCVSKRALGRNGVTLVNCSFIQYKQFMASLPWKKPSQIVSPESQ